MLLFYYDRLRLLQFYVASNLQLHSQMQELKEVSHWANAPLFVLQIWQMMMSKLFLFLLKFKFFMI